MTSKTWARAAVVGLRWLARVYGLLLVGLAVVFAIGWGLNPFTLPPVTLVYFGLLTVALVGLLVAWRWELTGGLMTVSGMVAFGLWGVVECGRWGWSGWVFWSVLAVGVLFVAVAFEGQASKATPA